MLFSKSYEKEKVLIANCQVTFCVTCAWLVQKSVTCSFLHLLRNLFVMHDECAWEHALPEKGLSCTRIACLWLCHLTNGPLHEAAGPVSRAGSVCWDLDTSVKHITTIFTTTRLFFSKHLWALCNTLPSIIPSKGSVWCYRNWIELEGIRMAPNYPVNLRWRVIYWLVRGFRVVDVARILHVW